MRRGPRTRDIFFATAVDVMAIDAKADAMEEEIDTGSASETAAKRFTLSFCALFSRFIFANAAHAGGRARDTRERLALAGLSFIKEIRLRKPKKKKSPRS